MAEQKDAPAATPAKSETPPVTAPTKNQAPRKLDETIPGGRYISAPGQYVDANGVPLKDKKEA